MKAEGGSGCYGSKIIMLREVTVTESTPATSQADAKNSSAKRADVAEGLTQIKPMWFALNGYTGLSFVVQESRDPRKMSIRTFAGKSVVYAHLPSTTPYDTRKAESNLDLWTCHGVGMSEDLQIRRSADAFSEV